MSCSRAPLRLAVLAVASALVAIAFAGCYDPTQIAIELTTDLPCSDSLAIETGILVGADELAASGRPFAATTTSCIDGKIGSLVVVPSDSRSDQIRIEVVAGVGPGARAEACRQGGPGCVRAARRLRFIPHRGLGLAIPLTKACVDRDCADPDATCIRGACAIAICGDPAACSEDALLAASDGGISAVVVVPADGGGDAGKSDGGTIMCDAGGDQLVPLCYRNRTISVPCYLTGTYLSAGAIAGPCA